MLQQYFCDFKYIKFFQDLFYNPTNNTGYLAFALKNINNKRAKFDYNENKVGKKAKLINVPDVSATLFELSQDDINFFKNCAAVDQEEIIKLRLQKTFHIRQKLFSDPLDIYKNFPFFFYNPNLVSSFDHILNATY